MPYVKYQSQDGEKSLFRLALDIFLRMLAAGFMCAIVYVSMNSIFLAFGSEYTGYTLQAKDESGNYQIIEKVVFEEGSVRFPNIDNSNMRLIPTEEMTKSGKTACAVSSQIIMLALFCVLLYTEIWSCGEKDSNLVKFQHITPSKFKGAKAGLLAFVPYFAGWIFILICNLNLLPLQFNSTFAFINMPFKPFIDFVLFNGFAWFDALLLLLPIVVIAVYSQIVYRIGYNQVFISEKILYTEK